MEFKNTDPIRILILHSLPTKVIAICALSILFAGAASQSRKTHPPKKNAAGEACRSGKSEYASGDVLKAIQSLNQCVEKEPRNRDALVLLANASLEAGRFAEAIDAFAKAQALSPGDSVFLTSYLSALSDAGKIDKEVEILSLLTVEKPGDPKIAERFLAAVEAAGKDKHPAEYLSALQTLGDSPEADNVVLEKLAAAYLGLGANAKAEAVYRRLLKKWPESPEYWAGLGASQSKRDPESAAGCYRKAALFSDQFSQREKYQAEAQRLTHAGPVETHAEGNIPVSRRGNASVSRENSKRAVEEKTQTAGQAQAAEQKARAEKEKQDSSAAAAKAQQEAEEKAKAEKAKQERALAEAGQTRRIKEDQDAWERSARERRERYSHAVALYTSGQLDSAAMAFKAVLQDSPVAEAFYYAGRTSLDRKQYEQALDQLTRAPADEPDLDGLKGRAWMALGKPKEALSAFETQFAKTKNDSLLEDLVMLKHEGGDEAGAMGDLEILADHRPGVEQYQLELAAYGLRQGDKTKAAHRYAKVLALDPGQGDANAFLGLEYAAQGDAAKATPMLEKGVAAYPKRPDLWKALAKAQVAQGRKRSGAESYQQAFALSPGDLEVAEAKLSLALELDRSAEIPQDYADVLKLDPRNRQAALGLAEVKFKARDFTAAENLFRIACADSKDPQALARFGRTLLEVKKNDEAAAVLQRAIDLGDAEPELRYDLARIRMEKGDLDGAEGLFKDLAKKEPADPEPVYWLGQVALKRSQPGVAEDFFRRANRMKPADGRDAEALARLEMDRDDFKNALPALRMAEPDLTLAGRLLYGDCLVKSGETNKALAVYAALYQSSPSPVVLSRRMDLLTRMGKPDRAWELSRGSPFSNAIEVQYSQAKTQIALAVAHTFKSDIDTAVDLLHMLLAHDDRNPEYHYYLGLGYEIQNRFKDARNEFGDALSYQVEYPVALYHLGLCQVRLGDEGDAENAFKELSQNADSLWKARGLYGKALVFEARGMPEAVAHHLALSILTVPLPEALAMQARFRLQKGEMAESEASARMALKIDPGNEAGEIALAEALAAGKRPAAAREIVLQALAAKPFACALWVESAKLAYALGRLDSVLAAGDKAIQICPEAPMGYYYAGIAVRGSKPEESEQFFRSFRKLGGDKKMLPEN